MPEPPDHGLAPSEQPEEDTADRAAKSSPPLCFRISTVPLEWSRDNLLDALRAADILPVSSNADDDKWDLYHYEKVNCPVSSTMVQLKIDRHFLGLTTLNDPGEDVAADVIAVTGMAGHAYGSWRSRVTNKMWLHDFLPRERDMENIRIMTYGYDSSLINSHVEDEFLEFKNSLIHDIECARDHIKDKNRPILFIGHSIGGIVILHALCTSKVSPWEQKEIPDSTKAIFFFGTPFNGFNINNLSSILPAGDSTRGQRLLSQLRLHSSYLREHKEALKNILFQESGMRLYSYYESRKTAEVRKSPSGTFRRCGEETLMVDVASAQLNLPFEECISIQSDHSNLVKFDAVDDRIYRGVIIRMKKCIKLLKSRDGETTSPIESPPLPPSSLVIEPQPSVPPFNFQPTFNITTVPPYSNDPSRYSGSGYLPISSPPPPRISPSPSARSSRPSPAPQPRQAGPISPPTPQRPSQALQDIENKIKQCEEDKERNSMQSTKLGEEIVLRRKQLSEAGTLKQKQNLNTQLAGLIKNKAGLAKEKTEIGNRKTKLEKKKKAARTSTS